MRPKKSGQDGNSNGRRRVSRGNGDKSRELFHTSRFSVDRERGPPRLMASESALDGVRT
jgi:hypothetical protein